MKIKVMSVFGTRPEAIKMAPLILELRKNNKYFESVVVATGQHREMLDQVLEIFDIIPDYDLNIMKNNQTLSGITTDILIEMDKLLNIEKPDIVLVHGDTTTAYVASLAAFYNQIKVGHVEAGLRTWDKYSPFPEEVNRQMIDIISDFYFTPTVNSANNLLSEGKSENKVYVTGNTVIDALEKTVQEKYEHHILNHIPKDSKFILMTMHRRENIGNPMNQVFEAVREVIELDESLHLVYPVHLNPSVKKLAYDILGNHDRVHLIEPLDVIDFHNFASRSYFIMTDSGGIQEEAASLNVPVLVLRDTTERPEGVEAGTLRLIGTEKEQVKKNMLDLLSNYNAYHEMSNTQNPYGDGQASKRIKNILLEVFTKEN